MLTITNRRADEIITPHQTTLLKLVDSYLQSIQLDISTTPEADVLQTHVSLGPFLAKRFFTLSNYAQTAMKRALGNSKSSSPSSPPKPSALHGNGEPSGASSSSGAREIPAELDVMLPKVCEALVLATQCVTTIALEAEEQQGKQFQQGSIGTLSNMKDFFIDVRYSSQGLVENLVGASQFSLSPP
jgi:ataxin-10